MSVFETVLLFVVLPGAFYGLVTLVTLRSKFAGVPRYRPGDEWNHPPVWWTGNPAGLGEARDHDGHDTGFTEPARQSPTQSTTNVRGGARGSW